MPTMRLCSSGHPLQGANVYRRAGRVYCRSCRSDRNARRYLRERDLLISREVAWLVDLPSVVEEAERLALRAEDCDLKVCG